MKLRILPMVLITLLDAAFCLPVVRGGRPAQSWSAGVVWAGKLSLGKFTACIKEEWNPFAFAVKDELVKIAVTGTSAWWASDLPQANKTK